MENKPAYAAYIVFRGTKPGVYRTWDQCQAQIEGNPKAKYQGYSSIYAAQVAWADWEKRIAVKLGASTLLQRSAEGEPRTVSRPVPRQMGRDLPLQPNNYARKYGSFVERQSVYNTPPSSSPSSSFSATKRPYMNISEEESYKKAKKLKRNNAPIEEPKIDLTSEQEKVITLALQRNNIFLTGAAGSGKTVTLKELLRRIRKRRKGGNVQVVAPTGISALPLNGRTTYSFAGWHQDSFRDGIGKLVKGKSKRVVDAINDLDFLVIEEISMVENHFLERLNKLFQSVLQNDEPFGGKQVIFVGDFHQLPPVLPFANCIQCGSTIAKGASPACRSPSCPTTDPDAPVLEKLQWGDKWAFKSKVWKDLKLRHFKLERIHRQKDESFQDILNKIRDGEDLTDKEWSDLERPKVLPEGAFPVRLMSRLKQVNAFNDGKLASIENQPFSWRAQNAVDKLISSSDGVPYPPDHYKIEEYRKSLNDHKFPDALTLKVGARVVLLHNLSHERGLVNGSQGIVVGFEPAPDELVPIDEMTGLHREFRHKSMFNFQQLNSHPLSQLRPRVKFANGIEETITAVGASSLRGNNNPLEQYVATRTQVPLALAWALSIHKSQGMTLEYVEVYSNDIFESGQLYVALSRATHLNGLKITGFNRNQLPMDPHVLKFYTETNWETVKPSKAKKKKDVMEAQQAPVDIIDLTDV